MANQPSTFERGLFPKLEGNEPPPAGAAIITIGGTRYDAAPYFDAIVQMGQYVTQFGANPYDPRALLRMNALSQKLRPALVQAARSPSAGVRQAVAPMVAGMNMFLKNSQALIQHRLKTSASIARAPKILVPVSLSIAAGASTTGIQIRNPYLGASGGATSFMSSPWAITSFRTSNGESGALLPIRITQFQLGGHDYVAAALGGITYTAGGAPATQGWAAGAFAETKRGNWKTEVQPWNVVATHGGGTGFGSIMTETGFLQLAVFNGGTATYVDTYSVYCNATLCGSPFTNAQWTQVDLMRKSFAPLKLQVPFAMKLAGDADAWAREVIVPDDPSMLPRSPYAWASRIAGAGDAFDNAVENAGAMAIPEDYIDPRSLGMPLEGDAEYVD